MADVLLFQVDTIAAETRLSSRRGGRNKTKSKSQVLLCFLPEPNNLQNFTLSERS